MFVFTLIYSVVFIFIFSVIDGMQNRQKDLLLQQVRILPADVQMQANRASGLWHNLGVIRNLLAGLCLVYIVLIKTGSWVDAGSASMLFLGVHILLVDGIISVCRGLGFDYYATVDGKWDWFDAFWLLLRDRFGISQMLFRIGFFLLTLMLNVW